MNKLICLALCALLAMSSAQAPAASPAAQFQLVPMVANVCKQGCPMVCQLLNTFCSNIPNLVDCAAIKTQCDATCTSTCACVEGCGPNCDTFEQNCIKIGLQPFAGIFCPLSGMACDGVCVVTCPQQALIRIFLAVFNQVTAAVQNFIMMLLKPLLSISKPT